MPNKKFVLYTIILLAIIAAGFIFFRPVNTEIETLNAVIKSDSVAVKANSAGTIKLITNPTQKVKKGQLIAEIETIRQIPAASATTKSKEDVEEAYEKAALMYKDGILSQEEYDKKVKTIKKDETVQTNPTKQKIEITKILAPIDGNIKITDINSGDSIKKDELIAKVYSSDKEIKAYFPVSAQKALKTRKDVSINVIKYPELNLSGKIQEVNSPEPNGLPVRIIFDKEVSNLNLQDGDSAIVKLAD